jgi:hypothetical protein
MVFGGTLLNTASQLTALHNEMMTEKNAESITFLDVEVTNQELNLTAYNSGGVPIHVVTLWFTNKSVTPQTHWKADDSYWINPGQILAGIGNSAGKFNASNTYLIGLATSRGNLFQIDYAPQSTLISTVQGFGWITIDWTSYQYTTASGGPYSAWCITQYSNTIQISVKAINHYIGPLRLMSWTYVKFAATSGDKTAFFIMDNSSTAQTPIGYSQSSRPSVLPPNPYDQATGGTPTLLKFLTTTPGYTTQQPQGISIDDYAILLVFFFQYTDSSGLHTAAQMVPYEASEVINPPC